MAFVKCTKCGTKINNVTGGIIKCPSCGHTMKLASSGKNEAAKKAVDKKSTDAKTPAKKNDNSAKNTGCGCLTVIVVLLILAFAFSSASGDKKDDDTKKEDTELSTDAYGWTTSDYANFASIVKGMSDEYVANYKTPFGLENGWQYAKFDDTGKIIVTTKYTFKNMNEKQDVVAVFTPGEDKNDDGFSDTYIAHFLLIGDAIYVNDGSCDDFFENLQSIQENMKE